MLDGSPLPTNAFIRDFQQGKAGYVADAVEQALLFPKDMADLRSLRRHGVFLSLKRDLTMVSLSINPFFCKFPPLCSLYYSLFSPLPCFFPQQAIQAMFRAEEITNFYHLQMKEEEGRWIAAVDAFHVAEKSNQELKSKWIEAKRDKKVLKLP